MDIESTRSPPPSFTFLLALANGERHGYAIMQEVETMADGQIRLGPGTLYRSIQRMLVDGLIEESETQVALSADDERRRYYRLTELGKAAARAEAGRLAALVEAAAERGFLAPKQAKMVKAWRGR